jgi:hypothetical protein
MDCTQQAGKLLDVPAVQPPVQQHALPVDVWLGDRLHGQDMVVPVFKEVIEILIQAANCRLDFR